MPPAMPLLAPEMRAAEFPLTSSYTYLNTATIGPLPSSSGQAIAQVAQRAQLPDLAHSSIDTSSVARARARMARLLHASEDDLVFTSSTTHGMNICAHGIEWRAGDNVVIPDREFPSLMYAWLQLREQGVEVRCVPWEGAGPSVDALMAAVDSRTRAVSCSAVFWDTGYHIDLEALGRRCAQAGCLLIVDGIQAVGAIDLDPQALGVSALSFHGYKWLMAGLGCGILYVVPSAIDQIRPRFVGELSFQTDGQSNPPDVAVDWQPGARRYTLGNNNLWGVAALDASLALIEQLGLPAIDAHNRALAQQLVDGLLRLAPDVRLVSPRDAARRAAIVVFSLGDSARDDALVSRLAEQGIVVALRRCGVRVSPHLYSDTADIERLLRALESLLPDLR